MTDVPAVREALRAQMNRDDLVERIARAIPDDGTVEPLKGLYLQRASVPMEAIYGVSDPAFCVIAQGSKVMLLGDQRLQYDPAHYLLITAEIPCIGQIVDASPAQPYLSLRLAFDPSLISSVLVEASHPAPQSRAAMRALEVSPLDVSLLENVIRLVRLLDAPADARFLMPLITREIIYQLLMGAQGDRLRQIAVLGGVTHRVAAAITRIRHDFAQALRIEDLAQEIGMSVSAFHHHFKVVTAMSPGQFQKHLRLQEARRLMLSEGCDAATAGAHVGYDDASYFTREYKKLFGAPPMHDVERLREAATTRMRHDAAYLSVR